MKDIHPLSRGNAYKDLLRYFRTYTVDVEFNGGAGNRQIFEYDKAQWPEHAHAIVAKVINRQFEDVKSSPEGNPYSYLTNPLNVLIRFSFYQGPQDADSVKTTVYIERSLYFSHFVNSKRKGIEISITNDVAAKMVEPSSKQKIYAEYAPVPPISRDKKSLDKTIVFYAETIAQSMNPEVEIAKDAERYLVDASGEQNVTKFL